MQNKIIIIGFPHCGTSILKSILGHCENVNEIINESQYIPDELYDPTKFNVCKWPFPIVNELFINPIYNDYIKIFIIRNPRYVFTSLNKRFENSIWQQGATLVHYYNYASQYLSVKSTKSQFKIKYEDIFDNNFEKIRDILDKIGIKYTNDVFNNNLYKNKIKTGIDLPKIKPDNKDHIQYRTWQINQPIENMNKDILLTDGQETIISHMKETKLLGY